MITNRTPANSKRTVPALTAWTLMFVWTMTTVGLAQLLGDERRSTAQIHESREAERLFREAQQKREEGDLEGFIKNVQEARNNYDGWLVKSRSVAGLFIGVERKARQLLLTLGKKGRRTYRKLFEEEARKLLQRARPDPSHDELLNVHDLYPLTEAATQALQILSSRYMKQAKFADAANVLRKQFTTAERPARRATVAVQYMFCLEKLGRTKDLQSFSEQLPDRLLDRTVHWKGESIKLKAYRQEMHEKLARRSSGEPSERLENIPMQWYAPGGNARQTKTHQPDVNLQQLELQFSHTPPPAATRNFQRQFNSRQSAISGGIKGFYPVVADGRVFFHNGLTVWSWPLNKAGTDGNNSNQTKPVWEIRKGRMTGSQVMYDDRILFPGSYGNGRYFCPLVTHLGISEQQMLRLQVRYPIPWRSLFAIDTSTGKVLWKRGGTSEEDTPLTGASFPAGAVHEDGVLYAPAVFFNTSKDTPNIYGAALDPKNGDLIWKTFITKNMLGSNLFENSIREVIPSVTAVGERNLYVSTNVGCIAALGKRNGRIKWAYRYLQRPFPKNQAIYPIRQRLVWQNNLPLLMDDTLLITPPDATHLLAMDAETGHVRWRHEQTTLRQQLRSLPRWVVPVGSEGYLIAGKNGITMFSIDQGAPLSSFFKSSSAIQGRPAVTRNHVYLPTKSGIEKIKYQSGDENQQVSFSRVDVFQESDQYRPGNLFLIGGALISAGPEKILLYLERKDL